MKLSGGKGENKMLIKEEPFSKEIIENIKEILEKYYIFQSVYVRSWITKETIKYELINKITGRETAILLESWEEARNKILITVVDVDEFSRRVGREMKEYLKTTNEFRLKVISGMIQFLYNENRYFVDI
jgi:hypothetical protein